VGSANGWPHEQCVHGPRKVTFSIRPLQTFTLSSSLNRGLRRLGRTAEPQKVCWVAKAATTLFTAKIETHSNAISSMAR